MNTKVMRCWNGLPMSQSSIASGLRCERYWFLKYRWHLKRKARKYAAALNLGTIYHWLMKEGPSNKENVKESVRKKQRVLEQEILDGHDLDGELAMQLNGLTDLYHKAETVADLFWRRFPRGEHQETLAREEHIVTGDLEGTIDEIEMNTKNGQVCLRDTKTTGRSLEGVLVGHHFGLQPRLYRLLAEEWCRNNGYESPIGFIVDAVLMPGIKLCKTDHLNSKKWKCSVETAYLRRVEEWYENKGTSGMTSFPIYFSEPLLPEELDHAIETIRELSERDPQPENYKRDVTRSYCFSYDKICPYYNLCRKNISMWPVELDAGYEVFEKEQKGEL